MKPDPRIDKALKLLDQAQAAHERTQQLITDAMAALTAEPSTTSVVSRLFDCFAELWKRRYQDTYVFAGAKDGAQFKRLLKTMPGEEIARRMKVYLSSSDDAFVADKKHPLGLFISTINRYGTALPLEAPPATGCTHEPPCLNDVVHTQKMLQDLKTTRAASSR